MMRMKNPTACYHWGAFVRSVYNLVGCVAARFFEFMDRLSIATHTIVVGCVAAFQLYGRLLK
jgi:hypothetical protein